MPTVELTDDQLVRLIEQLTPEKQQVVYQLLLSKDWERWIAASAGVDDKARRLAKERNLDWDAMNDNQRLAFIDDLVHDNDRRQS